MKKKKNNNNKHDKQRQKMVQLTKVREAQLGLDLNQFLGQTQTY